jgi:exosortase A
LAWTLTRLAAVTFASQFALLVIVQLSIVAILGLRVSRQLAFPLAFLLFAIPFGDFLLPWLIDRTADATVALLKISGVPVYREGNSLQIPSGRWSVVEACSGLRYLIASLVAGSVYAYIRYRSLLRRLIFVAAAIAIPLIANWLRAYSIVMLAHHTNNKVGTNVDHIIYGWVFFGLVMMLLFYLGSFWDESSPGSSAASASAAAISNPAKSRSVKVVLLAGLLCVVVSAVGPIAFAYLNNVASTAHPLLSPIQPANGWTGHALDVTSWRPHFANPAGESSQQFIKDGHAVVAYVALYRNQTEQSKLISSENVLVRVDDPVWKVTPQSTLGSVLSERSRSHTISSDRGQRLAVRQWYWANGRFTGSPYIAAALIVASRLAGQGDDAAAIVICTPIGDHDSDSSALDAFASEMSGSLSQMLESARLQR